MTESKISTISTGTSTKNIALRIDYVELLARSNFSFLQGGSHPEEMALQAQAYGYKGIGICDLNGLYGVVRAYQAIEHPSHFVAYEHQHFSRPDFSLHIGCELQLHDKSSYVFMPLNKNGYTQLCRIITTAKQNSPKGYSALKLSDIITHNDDLLCFALPPWNTDNLAALAEAYGNRLYIPVWKDLTWESLKYYHQALELERAWGLSLFATQRPFMHHKDRKPLHDVVTCILHKTTLHQAKRRLLPNSEHHLRSLQELILLWKDRPDLLQRTSEISSRIHFSLNELQYQYPQAVVPPGEQADFFLRKLVEQGLNGRFPQGVPQKVAQAAEHELKLIGELRYEDYFLTLWDICQFAHSQGILFQGRGSAANSVVCYALGLTAVDPTKIELLFERFLSKERGEPPDIDIDFESDRREEVIQYIYKKYGHEHAAMVSTVICYRSKMALREVGKVLGIAVESIDKLIRFKGREGFDFLREQSDLSEKLGINAKTLQLWLDLAYALKGFPRHLGIHTGGFLIAQRPITECVPIEKATMENRYVIQWNKDDINLLKMMKIDVLGLGMLTALSKCFSLLKIHKNLDWGLADLPTDDRPTYEMVQKADAVGVFQIESRAQMSLLPRLKPERFYDLVVQVAIIRPGPIQGGMVHPFIRRRHGLEKVTYAHPDLEPILGKTLGVPIFQEQIMQIASRVADFTPGEADELRRIMSSSWKNRDLINGLKKRLINGMLTHGVSLQYAEQIYKTIEGFSSYGFPESHAASFALLTYASSYLKCHHPEVFTCALLNSQPMGFYSPASLVADAKRHHVLFLPLDIQHSQYEYVLESHNDKLAIRVGFCSVRGIKKSQVKTLTQNREQGKFTNLTDFVRRVQLKKSSLITLAAAGAFECLGLSVRTALWMIQALELNPNSLVYGSPRESFDLIKAADKTKTYQPSLPKETQWEGMQREYRTKGYDLNRHPMQILRPTLSYWSQKYKSLGGPGFSCASELAKLQSGQKIRIAGLMSLHQKPPTAKGFAFLTLEDETGLFNLVITPKVYNQYRTVIYESPLMEVVGVLERQQGVINIKATHLRELPLNQIPH